MDNEHELRKQLASVSVMLAQRARAVLFATARKKPSHQSGGEGDDR